MGIDEKEAAGRGRWAVALFVALVVALGGCGAEAPETPEEPAARPGPPNIIIVVADDLGWGDPGCYGGAEDFTPRLDQLASEGVRFTDFHATAPSCRPTRAGLLTGRHQNRFGIDNNFANDPRLLDDNLALRLRGAGYATGLVGKWHLGFGYHPLDHGFDVFRGFLGGNIDYQSHISPLGKRDWWFDRRQVTEPGYTTRLITRHALGFIEQHRDAPFFLYVGHAAPHGPYQGPGDAPLREASSRNHDPPRADVAAAYREMVSELDASVGELRDALNALGIADQTLVVFLSDNGPAEAVGSTGPLRGRKHTVYEGGHRVPAVLWAPGRLPAGQVDERLASSLDIVPTALELAGVSMVAGDVEPPLDGRSLLAVPEESEASSRRLFWSFRPRPEDDLRRAVRRGPWKLVLSEQGDAPSDELYDLTADLGEAHDRSADHAALASELRAVFEAWEAEMAAAAAR